MERCLERGRLKDIGAKTFKRELVFLHGDLFLNEGAEVGGGVGYCYCGVTIHKFDLFYYLQTIGVTGLS